MTKRPRRHRHSDRGAKQRRAFSTRKTLHVIEGTLLAADIIVRARAVLRRYERDLRRHIGIVHIGDETVIELDDRMGHWQFTTLVQTLPPSLFRHPAARQKIKETSRHSVGDRRKGRVIYCVDERLREVVAAIAYHLPRNRTEPVLVTAWTVRTDREELAPEAMLAVYLAKRYIHALARKLRHPSYVDFLAKDTTMAADLLLIGFPELPGDYERRQDEIRFRQFED